MDKDLLGQILVANHFVTKKQLDAALEKQKNSPEHKLLGEILVKDGILTQRALDTILTVQRHKLEMKGESQRKNLLKLKKTALQKKTSLKYG